MQWMKIQLEAFLSFKSWFRTRSDRIVTGSLKIFKGLGRVTSSLGPTEVCLVL